MRAQPPRQRGVPDSSGSEPMAAERTEQATGVLLTSKLQKLAKALPLAQLADLQMSCTETPFHTTHDAEMLLLEWTPSLWADELRLLYMPSLSPRQACAPDIVWTEPNPLVLCSKIFKELQVCSIYASNVLTGQLIFFPGSDRRA